MNRKRGSAARGEQEVTTYQLKITLAGIKPLIWRRLLVRGDMDLGLLHAVFQVAMGWTNSHLHQFVIAEQRYCAPEAIIAPGPGEVPEHDETKAVLTEVVPAPKTWFLYEYDFGDSWEHVVLVERIYKPAKPPKRAAECLAGRRACPPDDCGGIYGYADLLKALRNPRHPDHEHLLEWVGGYFDPEEFDLEHINRCLRLLKWPHTTVNQLAGVLMTRDYRGGWVMASSLR